MVFRVVDLAVVMVACAFVVWALLVLGVVCVF